jgi:hypothetical protein
LKWWFEKDMNFKPENKSEVSQGGEHTKNRFLESPLKAISKRVNEVKADTRNIH